MRKLILLLTALMLLLQPFALASELPAAETDAPKLKVVATIFPQYDFIREIAGDRVELTMLLKPGAETHSYEPSPQEILSIQKCDLFVFVGGESDAWVRTILDGAPSDTRRDIALMDLVSLTEAEAHDHEHDEAHEVLSGHNHQEYDEYDEHVWTSPINAMHIVSALCEALCEADAANAEFYRANTESYLADLTALDAEIREIIDTSAKKPLVFGDRFPLTYFVKEYNLSYHAAFPGCASESEPSASTITQLMFTIMRERIPVVFYIELSSHQVADILAEQTKVETRLFYTCHNVSADDFAAGLGYLDMMKMNLESLKLALN